MPINDVVKLKQYCEKLSLGDKPTITIGDKVRLYRLLNQNKEIELAQYIEELTTVEEFEDLLTNVVYS